MPEALSAERLAEYARGARANAAARRADVVARQEQAWKVAHLGAEVLKHEFGAARVWVFGSLLYPKRFHARSDVDLAVEGLDARLYLRAVSGLLDLDPTIAVDLVELEHARPSLRETVWREGVEL